MEPLLLLRLCPVCFEQGHKQTDCEIYNNREKMFLTIEKLLRNSIDVVFIEELKTVGGDTQLNERRIIKRIREVFDENGIYYKEAGSQQSKDFQNVGSTGLDIEVKKTNTDKIIFNDTLPCVNIYYLIVVTGKKRKNGEYIIKPQMLFVNGSVFLESSPWVLEYQREINSLKNKWGRGENKKNNQGCMTVYPRPNYSASIEFLLNK